MCAKWQWSAWDCVTWLNDRRSRECNPVTPITPVIHTPAFPLLSHIYYVLTDLGWLLSHEFIYESQFYLHIFSNLLHGVDEFWWHIQFKGTRHGDGMAGVAVTMLLRLWEHATALWRHAVGIRIVTSHKSWMGYEYSTTILNRPWAINEHNPHPYVTIDKTGLHSRKNQLNI